MDQLVFQQQYFSRSGTGFALPRPDFASGNQGFAYLALGVFCALALVAFNVRKSTAGMSLSAVRWSEPGARMLGVGIVQMKMLVAGLAAAFAAVGGTFLGMFNEAAQPDLRGRRHELFQPLAGERIALLAQQVAGSQVGAGDAAVGVFDLNDLTPVRVMGQRGFILGLSQPPGM